MPRPRPDTPALKLRRGRWEIVWWDGSQRRRLSTGTADETGARQALVDFLALQKATRPTADTVGACLDDYTAAREGRVSAHSRLREAAIALKRQIGHLRLDQVNQEQWDQYARMRMTQVPRNGSVATHKPRPVSPGTLRREYNVLRAALRLAHKRGRLASIPHIETPADSEPRDRYLTKEEARRLLAACKTQHVRTFVALAVFTGARRGSILTLTWDRVDFASGMIDFREPGRTITAKRRAIVPMTAELLTEMEAAHEMRDGPVVVQYHGQPVPFGLRWSFRRLCVAAGLDWAPTPHHLKHSVASWFAMGGVPIDQAADWLATDPKTLRRVYRKFDPTYLRSVAGALGLGTTKGP
jgi:integrase